jgi:hypothetical protein
MAEPMTPEHVPADLVETAYEAWGIWGTGHMRRDLPHVLAAVMPAIRQAAREEMVREFGIHPEQTAERLKQPARPDSREEIIARLIPDVAPTVLREAADAYDAHLMAGGDPNIPCMWLRNRANRIEQEAAK